MRKQGKATGEAWYTEGAQERDAEDERRYSWRNRSDVSTQDAQMSTVALVARDRDELAAEFFGWLPESRHRDNEPSLEDTLRLWEEEYFGAALCSSAHGMLWFAVRRLLPGRKEAPDRFWASCAEQRRYEGAVRALPEVKDEGSLLRVERIIRAAGAEVGPGPFTMPAATPAYMPESAVEARLPYREYEEGEEPAWAHPADAPDAEREPEVESEPRCKTCGGELGPLDLLYCCDACEAQARGGANADTAKD